MNNIKIIKPCPITINYNIDKCYMFFTIASRTIITNNESSRNYLYIFLIGSVGWIVTHWYLHMEKKDGLVEKIREYLYYAMTVDLIVAFSLLKFYPRSVIKVLEPNDPYTPEQKKELFQKMHDARKLQQQAIHVQEDIKEIKISEKDVPTTNLPASNLPATILPATNLPASNLPATNLPATNLPATDAPTTDTKNKKESIDKENVDEDPESQDEQQPLSKKRDIFTKSSDSTSSQINDTDIPII